MSHQILHSHDIALFTMHLRMGKQIVELSRGWRHSKAKRQKVFRTIHYNNLLKWKLKEKKNLWEPQEFLLLLPILREKKIIVVGDSGASICLVQESEVSCNKLTVLSRNKETITKGIGKKRPRNYYSWEGLQRWRHAIRQTRVNWKQSSARQKNKNWLRKPCLSYHGRWWYSTSNTLLGWRNAV